MTQQVRSEPRTSILLYEEVEDTIGKVDLIDHMGSDLTIVNAARVSFGKEKEKLSDKDHKLIKYLIDHKHTSTLEHNLATFRFVVPLFVRSQHMRHRTWSYNEISRRYTSIDLRFYEPNAYRTQHDDNRQASNTENLVDPDLEYINLASFRPYKASYMVKSHHKDSLDLYNSLIRQGVCREQARGVLPQNLYTEYYGTVNLNNLLKFIELRLHEGAQWEIQKLAEACLEIAAGIWPVAVGTYRLGKLANFPV